MSSHPFPAAAPPQAAATGADPTNVIGRRIGAIVIDFLLFVILLLFLGPTPLNPMAEYYDTDDPGVPVESCEELQDVTDVSGCVQIGERLFFTDGADAVVQFVVSVIAVLAYSFAQGATGRTPGKAALGLKVVDEQGGTPGFGKSFLRTILWIVDALPCFGLVGFITGLTTKGHRRVGDMAAKTFVVGKGHTGAPQVPGMVTAAGAPTGPSTTWGGQPQGQPPGAWGGPPAGSTPAASGGPSGENRPAPPGGWTAPGSDAPSSPTGPSSAAEPSSPSTGRPSSTGPSSPGSSSSPTDDTAVADRSSDDETTADRPSATPHEAPSSPPGGTAAAGAPSPTTPSPTTTPQTPSASPLPSAGAGAPAGSPAQHAPSGYNPQWDAARGTYIVWEPNRGKWLGWDEGAQEWKPL
jgi:uncharacterized RDD family membrane protein YckC